MSVLEEEQIHSVLQISTKTSIGDQFESHQLERDLQKQHCQPALLYVQCISLLCLHFICIVFSMPLGGCKSFKVPESSLVLC